VAITFLLISTGLALNSLAVPMGAPDGVKLAALLDVATAFRNKPAEESYLCISSN
jgi:hypothetical protein